MTAPPLGHTVAVRPVVLGERPPELEAFLQRRRALGQDRHDEVWEGVYHVAPHAHTHHGIVDAQLSAALLPWARSRGLHTSTAFNLGEPHDFRVPDGAVHRVLPHGAYAETAAVVVEVVSPDDQTNDKLAFTPLGASPRSSSPSPPSARSAATTWPAARIGSSR